MSDTRSIPEIMRDMSVLVGELAEAFEEVQPDRKPTALKPIHGGIALQFSDYKHDYREVTE